MIIVFLILGRVSLAAQDVAYCFDASDGVFSEVASDSAQKRRADFGLVGVAARGMHRDIIARKRREITVLSRSQGTVGKGGEKREGAAFGETSFKRKKAYNRRLAATVI